MFHAINSLTLLGHLLLGIHHDYGNESTLCMNLNLVHGLYAVNDRENSLSYYSESPFIPINPAESWSSMFLQRTWNPLTHFSANCGLFYMNLSILICSE